MKSCIVPQLSLLVEKWIFIRITHLHIFSQYAAGAYYLYSRFWLAEIDSTRNKCQIAHHSLVVHQDSLGRMSLLLPVNRLPCWQHLLALVCIATPVACVDDAIAGPVLHHCSIQSAYDLRSVIHIFLQNLSLLSFIVLNSNPRPYNNLSWQYCLPGEESSTLRP